MYKKWHVIVYKACDSLFGPVRGRELGRCMELIQQSDAHSKLNTFFGFKKSGHVGSQEGSVYLLASTRQAHIPWN